MIALAVALIIMISAVAIVALKGPTTLVLADQGNDPQNERPNGGEQCPAEKDDCNDMDGDAKELAPCDTTITVCKTATGFWEMATRYSWSVVKELNANDRGALANMGAGRIQVEPGETSCISYIITAERSKACVDEVFGVRGAVVVTNTGCFDTVDLAICDTIQISRECGAFTDHASFEVDTSCHPVLAAGECYTYYYEYEFEPCEGAIYRNVADVTISNFADDCGEPSGVRACAEFDLPCEPDRTVIDDRASLVDVFNVPCGFKVRALTDTGPWMLDDKCSHFEVCVNLEISNVCAPRDSAYLLNNEAVLTACDSCTVVSDCVSLCIYSGAFETMLEVCKTADVRWTEDIKLGLNFPSDCTEEVVQPQIMQFADDAQPVLVEQYVISDKGHFVVCGSITVTNCGDYSTEGLFVTDTVQWWDGSCWIDVACVDVDLSCMPVLCPGQSYTYHYQVAFCLDGAAMIDFCENPLQNVAYAGACNWDDDSELDGAYYCLPLEVPFLPDKVTMETSAAYSCENCVPLEGCHGSTMTFRTEVSYHQLVEMVFCDGSVRLSVFCDVAARSEVIYRGEGCTRCADVVTAIHYEGCSKVTGEDACAEVSFRSIDRDDDCMTICVHCEPVDVNIRGLLVAGNSVSVMHGDDGFAVTNKQMMFYGAYACFEMPEDEEQMPD